MPHNSTNVPARVSARLLRHARPVPVILHLLLLGLDVFLDLAADVLAVDHVHEAGPSDAGAADEEGQDQERKADDGQQLGDAVGAEPQHDAHDAEAKDDLAQENGGGVELLVDTKIG